MTNVVQFDKHKLSGEDAQDTGATDNQKTKTDRADRHELLVVAEKHSFQSFALLDISEKRNGTIFPNMTENSFARELSSNIASVEDMSNCSVFLMLNETSVPFPFTTGLDCRTNKTPAPDLLDAAMDGMLNEFDIRGGYCVPVCSASGKRSLVMYFGKRAEGTNRYPELVLDTIESFDKLSSADSSNANSVKLSPHALACIELLNAGASLEEVGNELGLSAQTIGVSVEAILEILGVSTLGEAIEKVLEQN